MISAERVVGLLVSDVRNYPDSARRIFKSHETLASTSGRMETLSAHRVHNPEHVDIVGMGLMGGLSRQKRGDQTHRLQDSRIVVDSLICLSSSSNFDCSICEILSSSTQPWPGSSSEASEPRRVASAIKGPSVRTEQFGDSRPHSDTRADKGRTQPPPPPFRSFQLAACTGRRRLEAWRSCTRRARSRSTSDRARAAA